MASHRVHKVIDCGGVGAVGRNMPATIRRRIGRLLAAGLLLPLLLGGRGGWAGRTAAADAAGESREETRGYRILFQEEIYSYQVFAPRGYRSRPPGPARPAIVLLHGAGGNGQASIAEWRDLASEQGVLLVAPTLLYGPKFEPVIPTLLRAILAEVRSAWKPDPRRVYIFGHSAGGVLTFDTAMLDGDCFAAAAVHAAVIYPNYDWILGRARRRIPIAYYIGDRDQFFPLAAARRTRDLLAAAGFPLHYLEMPGHDHDYRAVAPQVNRDAWAFLSQQILPD
jgi:predicted esterase